MPYTLEDLPGSRWRLTYRFDQGTLNTLDDAIALPQDQYATFTNMMMNNRGPLQRRGGLSQSTEIMAANNGAEFFPWLGPKRSSLSGVVTYATDNADTWAWWSAGTLTKVASGIVPSGYMAHVGEMGVIPFNTNAYDLNAVSGCKHATYTGTATLEAGTAVTVIAAALTAAQQTDMVGSFLVCTDDSATTLAVYQIKAVVSATEVTLDRAYAGSAGAGVLRNIRIRAIEPMRSTAARFQTNSIPTAYRTASLWRRLVLLDTYEYSIEYQNRVRWSGLTGSSEGTSPFTGLQAFDANGYMDIPNVGKLIHAVAYGNAALFFGTDRLAVAYGSPTFDSAGSLDVSQSYDIPVAAQVAITPTPFGVFFISSVAGVSQKTLYVWDGSGAPRPVSTQRLATSALNTASIALGYYREHLFLADATGLAAMLVLHIPSGSWSQYNFESLATSFRLNPATDIGLAAMTTRYLLDVSNMVTRTTLTDFGTQTAASAMVAKTGIIGTGRGSVRPERMWLTYNATAALTATAYTGPASDNSMATPAGTFALSSAVTTQRWEINKLPRGNGMQFQIENTAAGGTFLVYEMVVEGTYEGDVED